VTVLANVDFVVEQVLADVLRPPPPESRRFLERASIGEYSPVANLAAKSARRGALERTVVRAVGSQPRTSTIDGTARLRSALSRRSLGR
jgi:hypothetical protein